MSDEQIDQPEDNLKYISVHTAVAEIENFCIDSLTVEFDPIVNLVHSYFEIVEKKHHSLLRVCVMELLKSDFKTKMPYPSDIVRIENELARIARLHGKMIKVKEGNSIVLAPVITVKKVERPPASGRFALAYEEINIISFQGERVQFPFECYDLFLILCNFQRDLKRLDVSAVTLQKYPNLLFDNPNFIGHYPLAGFVYNIIETYVTDEKRRKPYLNTLFESFLGHCLSACTNCETYFAGNANFSESLVSSKGLPEATDRAALVANTIDEYLEPFKGSAISDKDYMAVLKTLQSFFAGKIQGNQKAYFVKRGNKKNLGSELGKIYKCLSKDSLSFEYLNLCKQLFEIYSEEKISEQSYQQSRLYKYFHSKTKEQ